MKFDPLAWNEVSNGAQIESPKGSLRVRCSHPSPLYVEALGVEALAGVGTAFDLEIAEAVTWRIDGPEGCRVFVRQPRGSSVRASGEVYTNIDRMPHESGQMVEVQRALRRFELERRAAIAEIRAERDQLLALRQQAEHPAPAPAPEPFEPAPEVAPEAHE